MNREIGGSRAGARSRRVRRSASLGLGTAVVAGVAIAVGPVRRRLSHSLAWSHFQHRRLAPVSDVTVVDRVRMRLDPVTDELRLPPVRVTVANHIATLHGQVRETSEASVIEDAVASTEGVEGVISHLGLGVNPSVAPSEGEPEPHESSALRSLLASARAGGCPPAGDYAAVRTILAIFFEHLPLGDRTELLVHLPSDVRRLATSPRRRGIAISLLANNLDTIVDAVASVVEIPRQEARDVVVTVLQTLRELLPEGSRAIQTHLPNDLADLWAISPVEPKSTKVN